MLCYIDYVNMSTASVCQDKFHHYPLGDIHCVFLCNMFHGKKLVNGKKNWTVPICEKEISQKWPMMSYLKKEKKVLEES